MRIQPYAAYAAQTRPRAKNRDPHCNGALLSGGYANGGHVETAVLGYASEPPSGSGPAELRQQVQVIERECRRRGLALHQVVSDREPDSGKAFGRPGLVYALEQLEAGSVEGLVVANLARITRSAAELGELIESLAGCGGRLIAVDDALDTGCEDGRVAAALLLEVSRWERERLSERTRNGLQAARRSGRRTGRPAVADYPQLCERIRRMREDGMTLQAIADRLNEEGVPTVRGGAKWRHSSVQVAAGYRRRPHALVKAEKR